MVEQNRDPTPTHPHGGSVGPGQEILLTWRPEHTFVVTKEK